MDLRYKHLIAKARSRNEAIRLIKAQDLYAPIRFDIKIGLDFLKKQEAVNVNRIAIIGASFGSRVGLIAGIQYKVKALVLISLSGKEALPGSKTIKELLKEFGDQAILFVTCEKDWGGNYSAATDNKRYYDWAVGKKELNIVKGSGHGVDILQKPEAAEFVINWLKKNL